MGYNRVLISSHNKVLISTNNKVLISSHNKVLISSHNKDLISSHNKVLYNNLVPPAVGVGAVPLRVRRTAVRKPTNLSLLLSPSQANVLLSVLHALPPGLEELQ